jgi:hypothetical protein
VPLSPSKCVLMAWPLNCPSGTGVYTLIYREQRESQRFLIQLPITVRWMDGDRVGEAVAKTTDVSSRGLRFDLPHGPKSGSAIEVLMTLPHQVTQTSPVRVRCHGSVIRTSPKSLDKVEVAAAIQRFQFIRDAESAG